MKGLLETNAKMTINVMDRELAVRMDGALEPQGLARAPTILTMNLRLQTNAPTTQVTRIIKTGTTIVTVAGLALLWDGAKEHQDDHD
jgi:hypothetical protein